MLAAASRFLSITGVLAITALACFFGYRFVKADLTAQVYRERLATMAKDYETLRTTYQEAVRRSAVTELVVKDSKLSVRVRGSSGVIREVPTGYDPAGEIYVDYVVIDQRLWIRRVFDSKTAPGQGLVIDPELKSVDWNSPTAAHGKAVYRTLGEGTWIVSVSGDGSLGLAKSNAPADLVAAPEIKDYSKVEVQTREQADNIGPGDIWKWLVGK